jgi:cytochrome c556
MQRTRLRLFLGESTGTLIVLALAGAATAQAPVPFKPKPIGTLKQVMRSVPLPSSNIIFDVQKTAPKDEDEWKTVENASIAISESPNLILIPGRLGDNGKPVPLQAADFQKFAQGLVAAGQACYEAAKSRSQDKVSDCTDGLSVACANCHDVYRDRPQK